MLSRIAESLYWIGRYVERADDTSRMLDVHLSLLIEEPWAPEDVVCESLLSAMGFPPEADPDQDPDVPRRSMGPADVLVKLAWDQSNPASVVGALYAARENARRSREIVSTECWQSLNVTWHSANRPYFRTKPHEFFGWVRERCAAFVGTADSTLSRDEAWHFLLLGRSMERADMTARMVAARALAGNAGPSWVTLLRSCGAYHAFLRSSRGSVDDRKAIDFLLRDQLFPRSLVSALVSSERALDDLAVVGDRSSRAAEAHRVLGLIRSELEFAPSEDIMRDLHAVMERVQQSCSIASDAVTRRYFPRGLVTEWAVS
jgi:uncharacterized alpha-E superfamily protein